MNVNYIEVPSTIEEDANRRETTWRDGKCISIDEGLYLTVYIHHKTETISIVNAEGVFEDKAITKALPIRVKKPFTRAKAINSAEVGAYNLLDAEDVAAFGTSLSRKFRENSEDTEVKEHDEYIRWVKEGLDAIGFGGETLISKRGWD